MSHDLDIAPRHTDQTRPPRTVRRLPGVVTAFTLRYGMLAPCAIAYLIASTAVMTLRGAQWRGDLMWTLDWITVGHVVVGPIIAGLAAIDSARLTVGLEHLGTRRRRDPAVGIGVAYAAVLAVVHVAFVGVLVVVSRPARVLDHSWLALLAQIVMLGFFVALGIAVGRFARPALAGVVAAIAALAAVYLTASRGEFIGLLYGGAATVPRIGYAYNPGFLVAQIAMLVLVSAALLALRSHGRTHGWRRTSLPDAAAAVVLVVATVLVGATGPSDRISHALVEPTHCGGAATVQICYFREHRRVEEAFTNGLWSLVTSAQDAGYDGLVPDRIVQASQTHWPADARTGVVYIGSDQLAGAAPTIWELATGLVQPLHCEGVQQDQPPRQQYWDDLNAVIGTWVMLVDPDLGEANGYYGDLLPPDVATDLITQFRTCTYPFL